MKVHPFLSAFLILSLLAASFLPAAAAPLNQTPPGPNSPDSTNSPDDYSILSCNGVGSGGDLASLRGIVFTVSQSFRAVEVRMADTSASSATITAELRRSGGFLGEPDFTVTKGVDLPATGAPPYLPVTFDFGEVAVRDTETFSLRFVSIGPRGNTVYFEVFGIGNYRCANVMETDENDVGEPTERGDPAGFKVLVDSPAELNLASGYTTTPPTLDGRIGFGEWPLGNNLPFENGYLTVLNDSIRLYLLLNMPSDVGDDTGDYFWLTFDVDGDGVIDANLDLNYGPHPDTTNIRYQYYLGPNRWTGLQPDTFSARAKGFGCFFADGSLSLFRFPFGIRCNSHRLWELGIDLAEIGADAGDTLQVGLRVASGSPAFTNEMPAGFSGDFSSLIQINTSPSPFFSIVPSPLATVHLEADAFELTQAIQDRDNTLPLVWGKTTTGRVYVDTNGVFSAQPSIAYLYGKQGLVDLPGSPLAKYQTAPTVINRATLNDTANFQLPLTWTKGGQTEFFARSQDMFGNSDTSASQFITFYFREDPLVWIVPINTGTNASPVLVSDAEIASQESAMEAAYPVRDIRFVHKPWQVIGPTTVANTIDDLNEYFGSAVLAWILGLIFGGSPPFELPDQVYGFTPSGGGISDPTWYDSGSGYVARGFRGTSGELTMAHEINHNLDRSSDGRWGRHVPDGCGAGGPDAYWPYADDDIQEVGFDTRLPWQTTASKVSAIPDNWPDFMSYCQSGKLPTKWISPYRWNHISEVFAININRTMLDRVDEITDVFYLSGTVYPDGTGVLDPALQQLGMPSEGVLPGDYRLELQDSAGAPLASLPFAKGFVDVEGEPLEMNFFSYQIAKPAGAVVDSIVLYKGSSELDRITASDNPPTVSLTSPNGGETWGGDETVTWTANDPDHDELTFTLLYSPDNGVAWFPLAAGLTGTSYNLNTIQLVGGEQALIRIIASDGFHNAEDTSDAFFTVANNAPVVSIQSPKPSAQVPIGVPTTYTGDAFDVEDGGVLPEEAFVWLVDGEPVADGRSASFPLEYGVHTITLVAGDSQGLDGEASIQVFAGEQLFLPSVANNH